MGVTTLRIIDINAAIGAPLKAWRFTSAEALTACLEDYRIDCAVTYHKLADRTPEEGNALMLETAAASKGKLKPCLLLEPTLDSLGVPGQGTAAERLRAAKPSAVRVMQGQEPHFWMDAFYAQDLLAPLNELHMPLILDGGYTERFFHALPEMARAYPNVPMIILRHGLNESRTIYPLLKYTSNVYFDMSTMLDAGGIEEICEKFGSERLLFGSGLPHFVPAGALALLIYARISQQDKENIAHANFERLEGGILQ